MKIQHLKFFCAVVECRSVTAAADRLHMSQPAISAGLKALQEELGQPLFERSGGRHRIKPNARALRFYDDAREILVRCESAVAGFAKIEPQPRPLQVGILNTLASSDVATVLSHSMLSPHPWRTREGSASELGRWLTQGQIDIAWTSIEKPSGTSAVLWTEAYVVWVARHHRLAQRPIRAVTIAELAGEPIVLRTSCELKSGKLQRSGFKVRIVARANRDDLALRLVAQGVGLAIAPLSFATTEIVALPISDLDLDRDIGLSWRPDLSDAHIEDVKKTVLMFGKPAQSMLKGLLSGHFTV